MVIHSSHQCRPRAMFLPWYHCKVLMNIKEHLSITQRCISSLLICTSLLHFPFLLKKLSNADVSDNILFHTTLNSLLLKNICSFYQMLKCRKACLSETLVGAWSSNFFFGQGVNGAQRIEMKTIKYCEGHVSSSWMLCVFEERYFLNSGSREGSL